MNTTGRVLVGTAAMLAIIAITQALAAQAPSPEDLGEQPDLTNTVCPVTAGEAVDPGISTEYEGARCGCSRPSEPWARSSP